MTGYRAGLLDTLSMAKKRAFERELQARIAADPKLQAQYGGTWDAITAAQSELATFSQQLRYQSFGGNSRLLTLAGQVVRIASESGKPDSARLAAYRGAAINNMSAQLSQSIPIDTAFERLAIAAQLRAAQSELGPSDPFVRIAVGGRTPEAAAAALVRGTRLGDPRFARLFCREVRQRSPRRPIP